MSEWISVKDRLLLSKTDDCIISRGWWETSKFNPNDENGQIDREVIHWMPMPEPPKEVE